MKAPTPRALWALALLHLAAVSAFGVTVTQTKVGNVFTTSEQPVFTLNGAGTSVDWTVKDYLGQTVASGNVALVSGTATLSPAVTQPGWFELNLTEKSGTTTIGTFATTFARIAPVALSPNSPYGAQTHFASLTYTGTSLAPNMAKIPDLLDVIARGNIAHIRDEHYWQHIEKSEGSGDTDRFDPIPPTFSSFMAEAAARGITPFLTADWSHPDYDYDFGEQTAPITEYGVAGYANYVRELRERYGAQVPALEIWNEYNGTFAKGPQSFLDDRPLHYYNMLRKTYEVVKQAHPDVQIIAGGVVPVAHGFLNRIFEDGAMPYLDAVSVHPYRAFPEGVELEMNELNQLIKSYNNGQSKPIWATEFSKNVTAAADRLGGAYYLVQQSVMMRNAGVVRMYYYLTAEDNNFPYRGLVRKSNAAEGRYVPNPGFVAYATLAAQTHDWTPSARITAGLKRTTYAYKLTKSGQTKHVLWATSPATVELSTTQPLTKVDTMGVSTTLTPQNGKIVLAVDANPSYLTGTIAAFADVNNLVIADTASDYDKTQGANGWSYGYATLAPNDPYDASTMFKPLTWAIWKGDNYRWKMSGATTYYPFATIGTVHPGGSNWVIKRWESPITGTIRITGSAAVDSEASDGVSLRVFVDSSEVHSAMMAGGGSAVFDLPDVPVQAGSKVDFAFTKVVSDANDATTFSARIYQVAAAPVLTAPTNLTAQGVANDRIQLFWDDNAEGETAYEIEWKWGSQAYAPAATVAPNTTAFVHSVNMAGGRVYTYRVRAVSGLNASAWSNTASAAEGTLLWYSTQYALTVNGGSNSGTYYPGTIVPVTAAPPPQGQTFAAWTGDVSAVASPAAASTSVTMPAGPVAITATYQGEQNEGQNWTSSDIGSVGLAGSFTYDAGAFTINGSGADIWGAADAFHFVRRVAKLSGDGTIVARVNSITNTHGAAKAGVMIRETTASNSKYAYVKVSPTNGTSFQYRSATGGNSSGATVGGVSPQWLKLTRSGNQFSAFRSSDGATWTQIGVTTSVTMASEVEIGLAVTSHNNAALCTGVLTNVSVTAP